MPGREMKAVGNGWVREDEVIVIDASEFNKSIDQTIEDSFQMGKASRKWRDPWQWAAWLAVSFLLGFAVAMWIAGGLR